MNPFIWILLACVAGLLIAHQVAMRAIAARAQRRMDADGPEALLDYLDGRWPNRLMPAYNLNYMRFAAYRRATPAMPIRPSARCSPSLLRVVNASISW